MAGSMTVDGIVSGLSTEDIIQKLMDMRKKAVERVQDRQAELTTKLSAWQDLNTRMLALKLKTDTLSNPNTFSTKSVTSDSDSILTATAGNDAITGTYYVKVKSVAKVHQIQSQGYDDIGSIVGTGDIKIKVGQKETTIKVDSNCNSLVGIKDAINRSDAGVKAAIVDTGATTGRYKLIISSKSTGTENSITVTVPPVEEGGLNGGTLPTFTDLQAATNAELEFGSGAGAIQVTKPSNQITGVVPGVTLNLKSEDVDKVVTINVNQDNESVKKAVNAFVDQYNNVVDFINRQFDYDSQTKATGTLFGDFSLMTVQMGLGSTATDPVKELSQTVKALSQVGIKSDSNGKLVVGDDFTKILDSSPDQIKALFSSVGSTTDPNVVYISGGNDTKTSSAGYSVEITRLATKTRVTAGAAQTQNLTTAETLTINGRTITLEAGWSPQEVIDAINSRSGELGVTASRTGIDGQGTGDYLTLTSVSFGSSANLTIKSSVSNGGATPVANSSGYGNVEIKAFAAAGENGAGTGVLGYDVLGKINGKLATGSGQILTSQEGDSKGIRVMVTGGVEGSRGLVSYTRGVASLMSGFINTTTDKVGVIGAAEETLNRKISDAKAEAEDLNARLQKQEERLRSQFTAMENAMAKLKSQGDYLSQLSAYK